MYLTAVRNALTAALKWTSAAESHAAIRLDVDPEPARHSRLESCRHHDVLSGTEGQAAGHVSPRRKGPGQVLGFLLRSTPAEVGETTRGKSGCNGVIAHIPPTRNPIYIYIYTEYVYEGVGAARELGREGLEGAKKTGQSLLLLVSSSAGARMQATTQHLLLLYTSTVCSNALLVQQAEACMQHNDCSACGSVDCLLHGDVFGSGGDCGVGKQISRCVCVLFSMFSLDGFCRRGAPPKPEV